MMTAVKTVLQMDHSLVKGKPVGVFLTPPQYFPLIFCAILISILTRENFFYIAEVASPKLQKGNLEKASLPVSCKLI